jgi:hypothetical protein
MPLVLPRIPTTPAAAQLSFSDVRAHLRHAGTPVEAPINSSFTATTKRVGQPTIGVPADKMAAFLKEMKSVRLRKVYNAPADMCRPPPRVGSADNSFVGAGIQRPPRLASGAVTVGEKRKREVVDTLANDGVNSIKRRLMGPFPRSADSSFRSTDSSFSQSQSQSQRQSQTEAESSQSSRSYLPVQAWPSSSVDGTDVTPSLTSDGDAEQGPDEPSPPTPPQVPAVVVQRSEEVVQALPQPPSPDPERVTPVPVPVPRPPTPTRRSRGTSAQSAFDKRPPLSPLPAPSPRKARPPSRTIARPRLVVGSVEDEDEDEDDDDPLASAELDPLDSPLAVVATRPRKERRPATTTVTASGGRHRQARRKGAVSSTRNGGGGGVSSKSARRRTLDEELRNSDGITDEDLRLLDLEPPVFTSIAPTSGRGQKKGFLAHGGGAGVPVFMGAADEFDGAGAEDHEEDIEIIDPPAPLRPSLIPRKLKGRAASGIRRR